MRKINREWHIEIYRKKKSRFKTVKVEFNRREKQRYRRVPGILHKAVNFRKNPYIFIPFMGKVRITGDLLNIRKRLKNWKPKTVAGQVTKSTFKTWYKTASAVEKTALGVETAGIKIKGLAVRGIYQKYKNKLRSALNSGNDTQRLTAKTVGTAIFLTRLHKTSKEARRIKKYMNPDYERGKMRSFKLAKKEDGTLYRSQKDFRNVRNISKKFKKTAKLQVKDEKYNANPVLNIHYRQNVLAKQGNTAVLLNKRKIQRSKLNIKLTKNELKINKTKLKYKKRIYKSNKKLFKMAKSAAFLDVDKAVIRGVGREIQKASGNNDIVTAVTSINRIKNTVVKPKTTATKLKAKEARIGKLQSKLSQKDGKLHVKQNVLQSKRDNIKFAGKRQKLRKQNRVTAALNVLKKPQLILNNVVKTAVKKVVAPIVGVVMAIVIPIAIILYSFMSLVGGSMIIGVYNASDDSLTKANQYYTAITFNANAHILDMSSDYKANLAYFGIDISGYDVEPTTFSFNDGVKVSGDLTYDYDSFKLWSFLCACYYDFSLPNDKDSPPWTYNTFIEYTIRTLWAAEYEFKHVYNKTGYWEAISKPYPTSDTDPTGFYFDGDSDGEIMDYRYEGGKKTGWWAVTTPRHWVSTGYQDNPDYDTWLEKKKKIDNMSVNSAEDGAKKEQAYKELGSAPPQTIETGYWVPAGIEFQQREKWVEEAQLYYTINRKQSLDSAINQLMELMDYTAERKEYYNALLGTETLAPGAIPACVYGGHQTMSSPFADNLQTLRNNSRIIHINGYDFKAWNTQPCADFLTSQHSGIDVKCVSNEQIYAPGNGIIQNVTATSFEIYIENLPYYSEVTSKYSATILFSNAKTATGITNGVNVAKGQLIGRVTADTSCGNLGTNYLHIKITANQDGNIDVDPQLLFE